jgi:hypothetical protein
MDRDVQVLERPQLTDDDLMVLTGSKRQRFSRNLGQGSCRSTVGCPASGSHRKTANGLIGVPSHHRCC